LLLRSGSAEAALDAVPNLASRGGGKAPVIWSESQAEAEMARVEALGARYLSVGQGLYPRALADLDSASPLLIVKGDLRLLDRTMVAIVGARNASAAACRFARGLTHDAGREEIVVTGTPGVRPVSRLLDGLRSRPTIARTYVKGMSELETRRR
jgi:DNA processing protein